MFDFLLSILTPASELLLVVPDCASCLQVPLDDYKDSSFVQHTDNADIDVRPAPPALLSVLSEQVEFIHGCVCLCQSKLSRLCEQDKAVRMQEEKLQQLHREKVQAWPLLWMSCPVLSLL